MTERVKVVSIGKDSTERINVSNYHKEVAHMPPSSPNFHSVSMLRAAIGVPIYSSWSTISILDPIDSLRSRSMLLCFRSVVCVAIDMHPIATISFGIVVEHAELLETICSTICSTISVAVGLDRFLVQSVAGVTSVDKGLKTFSLSWIRLHQLLVCLQSCKHLFRRHIVQEDAASKRTGYGSSELAVSGLEYGFGALVQDLLVELVVVHRQTCSREKIMDSLAVCVT